MEVEESAPRTRAERLHAARRAEAAALYEMSFSLRRAGFAQNTPRRPPSEYAAFVTGPHGQLHDGNIPAIQRLIRGDFYNNTRENTREGTCVPEREKSIRRNRGTEFNESIENISGPALTATETVPCHDEAMDFAWDTVSSAATASALATGRPLRVMSGEWTQRPLSAQSEWRTHGAPRQRRPQSAVSAALPTTKAMATKAMATKAVATTTTATTTTATTATTVHSRPGGVGAQTRPTLSRAKGSKKSETCGAIFLSKEEYQRIRRIIS